MAEYGYIPPRGGSRYFGSSALVDTSPEVRAMAADWLFGSDAGGVSADVTTQATSSLTVAIATPVIAAWGFERPGTSFTDVVGGRVATLAGDAAQTSGHASAGSIYNPTSSIDGSGAVTPATGLQPSSAVGVSAWVATLYTGGSYNVFVSKSRTGVSDSYALYSNFGSNNAAFIVTTTNGLFSAVSPTAGATADGNWHNVAGTYDGQYVRLFIDYVEVAATAATGALVYDANGLGILTSTAFPVERLDGQIDDVRIWGSAPSQAEIAAAGPIPVIDPPLTFTATVTTSANSTLTVSAEVVTEAAVLTTATSSLIVSAIISSTAEVITLATSTLTVDAYVATAVEVTTLATSSLSVSAGVVVAYEPICGFVTVSDAPLWHVTVGTLVRHVVVTPAAATHVVVDPAPVRHVVLAEC